MAALLSSPAVIAASLRGARPVDYMALAVIMTPISWGAVKLSDCAEPELSPLVGGPDGAIAVDAGDAGSRGKRRQNVRS